MALVVASTVAAGTTIALPYPFVNLVTVLVHLVPVLVNRYRRGVSGYRRIHLELLTGARRWVPVLRGCESFTADASLSKRGYG